MSELSAVDVIAEALGGGTVMIGAGPTVHSLAAARSILAALEATRHATVKLPEPTGGEPGNDDENGFVEWDYPHGTVQVFEGGIIGWHGWHIANPNKVEAAAGALLAAVAAAREADK